MKHPQKLSMPSGIQLWLEEQLETRGIDASVYSTYILGVLCNDSSSNPPIKPKDSVVKNLIEEFRVKLKGFQEKGQYPFSDNSSTDHFEDPSPQFLPEKASRSSSTISQSKLKKDSSSSSLGSSSVWSGKRSFGSSVGKNRTISEGNNRDSKLSINWLEEDKENNGCNRDVCEKMRSRSTVKQQTPDKASRNMAKSLDRKEDLNRKMENSKSRRLYQQTNELSNEQKQIQTLWSTEKSFDDLTGCDQYLPMDFQQLLESPEASKMSLDFSRCISAKQPTSFIQCGTNITSSIWSEKADDVMECSLTGETSSDLSLNFNTSAWGTATNEAAINRSELLQDSNNCFKPSLWGQETGFFNGEPWKAVGNTESKESLVDFGKWSDVEGTRLMLGDTDNFFSSLGSNIHGSFTALNHNKEDSSFTEVIPKVNSNLGIIVNKEVGKNESATHHNESLSPKKDEEDLLISMKTHFRPIKQETVEIVTATAPSFPDGTTFPISNSLDKPNFHRSPGGGLYLDSDANNKYMEFNDVEDNTPSEFVPKFRVRQNEKFCQTEDLVLHPIFAEQQSEELYFPEDEKLVRSMVEEVEDNEEEEEDNSFWGGEACIKVDGWMATWPATGIWSNEPNIQQIWCGGSLWNTGTEPEKVCESEGLKEATEHNEYNSTRLRSEWTQEAEQLFSDISQHLCLTNYVDTQPPKIVEKEWKAMEPTVIVRGMSRERKRRHWSSQLGANCPALSRGPSRSRPLTL